MEPRVGSLETGTGTATFTSQHVVHPMGAQELPVEGLADQWYPGSAKSSNIHNHEITNHQEVQISMPDAVIER